jgi:glutathione S-transferase
MYTLYGIDPSPYSVKMRALLRYRRIPFVWEGVGQPRDVAVAAGLPPVIPVLRFPDGRLMNDSTPLAYALEREHPAVRSVIPDDAALAFVSDLLEDFGDEWVTKMMFHYRWYYQADRDFAQAWVVTSRDPVMEPDARRAMMQAFNDRQVGRMALVGCTEQNRPVIEESYRFVLDTLDRHLRELPFLLGTRPSLGDFGLYGQLQILSVDPTPAAEMRARAIDVFCWLMRLDDASGVEGMWIGPSAPLPTGVVELLRHAAVPRRQPRRTAGRARVLRGRAAGAAVRTGAVPISGEMLRRAAQEVRRAARRRTPPARASARGDGLPRLLVRP